MCGNSGGLIKSSPLSFWVSFCYRHHSSIRTFGGSLKPGGKMMTKLLLSGFACCSLLTADFSAPAWRYRRPLSVTPPVPVSEFTVDASLCRDSAANLDDLRI